MTVHTHLHADEGTNINVTAERDSEDAKYISISLDYNHIFLSEDQALLIAKKINELTKED